MNLKLCKRLRRLAGRIGNPDKDYLAREIPRIDGTKSYQFINDPESIRGVYRQLKRNERNVR